MYVVDSEPMKKIIIIWFLLCLVTEVFAYTRKEVESANKLAKEGIIEFKQSEYSYRLNDTITRKEFMKVFANLSGNVIWDTCGKDFRDVQEDWGCKYVTWALEHKHIAPNGYFRPSEQITKAESMKLILKARGIARQESTGDWRVDDMKTARLVGIIAEDYSDYDSYADRWWIFDVAATDINTYQVKKSSSNSSASDNPYLVP